MTVSSETGKSGPYNGNGVTTAFDYEFKIADETHLTVILRDTSGVEHVLELTTDYDVTGVGNSSGGQIELAVAPASGETITIIRNVPFTQEVDLENQGPYYAETIEDALDLMVMRDQQLQEQIDRAVRVPASADPSALNSLVEDIIRIGDSVDNMDVIANNIADVNTVAANIADVNTVAGDSAAVVAVASGIDEVKTVAANVADVVTVATDIADVSTVAADIDAVSTVAPDIADVKTVASDIADVSTVAGDIASVVTVATNIADVVTVATDIADVSTVASDIASVKTVATDISDVVTVAGNINDVKSVSADIADVGTVADNIGDVKTVAENIEDIISVGTNFTQAWKTPCITMSSTNVTLSGTQTINGVTLTAGHRVLLNGQTDAKENGIWIVQSGAWERAPDMAGVVYGARVRVMEGVLGQGVWELRTNDPIVVGTTALSFDLVEAYDFYEYLDAEIYYRKYGANEDGFKEALKALINAGSGSGSRPMVLNGWGIPVDFRKPLLARHTADGGEFSFGGGINASHKIIRDVRMNVVDDTYTWQDRDYVLSMSGRDDGSSNMYGLVIQDCMIDMNQHSLVGLHVAHYYHFTADRLRIRRMVNNAIGILSTADMPTRGVNPGIAEPAAASHGFEAIDCDIFGSGGNDSDPTQQVIGIYSQSGDFNVKGGWLSFLRKGIVQEHKQINVRDVHFSPGPDANGNAVCFCEVWNPVQCLFSDNEVDHGYYQFGDPSGTYQSVSSYRYIHINGGLHSADGFAANIGLLTFNTKEPNTIVYGLKVDLGSNHHQNSGPLMRFNTSGSGSWGTPSGYQRVWQINLNATDTNYGGTVPAGYLNLIAGNGNGAIYQEFGTGRMLISSTQNPTANAAVITTFNNRGLEIGQYVEGTYIARLRLTNDGLVFRPDADAQVDLGASSARWKDAYVSGAINLGNIQLLSGNQNPEGNVAAPAGSYYFRQNGVVYRKASGSGASGWVNADTTP